MKPPSGAPLLIFPQGYLPKFFPQEDASAREWGFGIRVFPLLGELPKAIEPHLPVCQLFRWQLGPTMWSSTMTKVLDPIVVTTLLVDFPGDASDPPHVDLSAIVRSQRCALQRCLDYMLFLDNRMLLLGNRMLLMSKRMLLLGSRMLFLCKSMLLIDSSMLLLGNRMLLLGNIDVVTV